MTRRTKPPDTARSRTTQINFLAQLLLPAEHCSPAACRRPPPLALTTARAARSYRGLANIGVRDVVLRRIGVSDQGCQSCWSQTIDTLSALLRGAPNGHVAPVATVLALVAWLQGEGALANLSLQRAEEEPGYRLAELAVELMARGIDPRAWRESLAAISEAECLTQRE